MISRDVKHLPRRCASILRFAQRAVALSRRCQPTEGGPDRRLTAPNGATAVSTRTARSRPAIAPFGALSSCMRAFLGLTPAAMCFAPSGAASAQQVSICSCKLCIRPACVASRADDVSEGIRLTFRTCYDGGNFPGIASSRRIEIMAVRFITNHRLVQ